MPKPRKSLISLEATPMGEVTAQYLYTPFNGTVLVSGRRYVENERSHSTKLYRPQLRKCL